MTVEENLEISVEPNQGWDSRIRCVKCGDLVRAYLIKTERFLLVYDTLLGPKSGGFLRREALDFAEERPLMVVNSHADWDHYFGNMLFPEPILGSLAMIKRVTGGVGAQELSQKQAEHPDSYAGVTLCPPSIGVPSNATLWGGDLTIELLLTRGHRPDHLALHIPEISTLLPGDCVEDPIPLVDEDSEPSSRTIRELSDSLQLFLDLKPEWVLANHAAPQRGVERVESNLNYLQKLRGLARSVTNQDALKAEFPPDPAWASFYQSAHLKHLRMARQQTRSLTKINWADD